MPDALDEESLKQLMAESDAKVQALTAETKAMDAEVARIAAQKKLTEARTPTDPGQVASADALAVAKREKDLAEAQSARIKAEMGLFTSRLGDIPVSGIQGGVTLSEKAGSMETALLAAKALAVAGKAAANAIAHAIEPAATVIIFASGEMPDLKALTSLRSVGKMLSAEFSNAQDALAVASGEEFPLAIPAIAVALDVLTKVSSYFRSDFTVGGTELTADHAALAELIAGQLRMNRPGATILLPGMFQQYGASAQADFFTQELNPLAAVYQATVTELGKAEKQLNVLTAQLGAIAGTTDEEKSLQRLLPVRIGKIQAAVDRTRKVIVAYEAFLDNLVASKDNFDALVRQYDLFVKLAEDATYVLTAKVHKVGGSNYVEKNMWTLFGAMPFHVMGGAVVSYSLFQANSGNLLASETIPIHSGFESVKTLGRLFGA